MTWVAGRRDGRTVADIAAGAGVSKATVSRATSPHGPFPSPRNRQEPATLLYGPFPRARLTDPSTAAQWAEDRRRRVPAAAIAQRCRVPISRVYDATRAFGPFPSPLQGAAGTVSREHWIAGGSDPRSSRLPAKGLPSLPLGRAGARFWVVAVQDLAARPWEDEPLVAVAEPDEVRRGAVVAPDLKDLCGVVCRTHLLAVEEKPLTDLSLHGHHLLQRLERILRGASIPPVG